MNLGSDGPFQQWHFPPTRDWISAVIAFIVILSLFVFCRWITL